MMREIFWGIVIVMIMGDLPRCFGDGGTLTLTTLAPEDQSASWALDLPAYDVSELVNIQIEGIPVMGSRGIYSFGNQISNLFITDTNPIRIYCDSNQDGRYQSNEEIEGENSEDFIDQDERIFRNVPLSYLASPSLSPFLMDICCTRKTIDRRSMIQMKLLQCKNIYEGTLSIKEKAYQARLLFQKWNDSSDLPKAILQLDENRDGRFHPIDDSWFECDQIAIVGGMPYRVQTQFLNREAFVTFTGFTGPTGTLQLQGEGISQVILGKRIPGSIEPIQKFSIPYIENASQTLPVGLYSIMRIWLRSQEQLDVVYQWPDLPRSRNEDIDITIEKDTPFSVWIGGPLKDSYNVISPSLYGNTWIEFDGIRNQRLYRFAEIKYDDPHPLPDAQTLFWSMKSSQGQVIHAGQFYKNRALIRMPFWGNDTYRVQRLGSDNELIQRSSMALEYHFRQPILYGSSLFIFSLMVFYLVKVDFHYSLSKLWMLFPGIVGLGWIFVMEYSAAPNKQFMQSFGIGPLSLTFMLLACRLVISKRIAFTFITAILSSCAILLPVNFVFINTKIIIIIACSLIYSLEFVIFYQLVRGKTGWPILSIAFLMALGIPIGIIKMLLIFSQSAGPLWFLLLLFGPFALSLYGLTARNTWVRDLLTQRMFDMREHSEEPQDPKLVA